MSSVEQRVLITRAARQSSELAERLRALGFEPVLVPAIETIPPASFAVLDEALAHLEQFDWLLFTSANAAEAAAARFGPLPLRFGGKVAAIGPATANALRAVGLVPDLIPPKAVAESLTAALLPYARRLDGTASRFLLIRAEEARERLPEDLRAAGAEVTIAAAYRTVIPAASIELVRQLFGGSPAIDAITFTSSSTARNLLALCDAAGVTLPISVERISIGPITTQTLGELGIPAHAEAREATISSLVEAVVRVLARAKEPGPQLP